MGLGGPSGASLGAAQGSITINTSQAQQAVPAMQGVAQGVNRALSGISAGVTKTENSFGGLANAARQLSGAFGLTLGAAGVAQLARVALNADAVATAYARQSVAAISLAGSQEKLNELLDAYNKATGNTIDRASALADVTRLQAIGFADTTEELERFVTVARGISLATGQSQDYVISQLQLAIANQSTLRLDQLGLGVSQVKQRIDELRSSGKGLTAEMAYQEAVLGLAERKFGALTDSIEAQATGAERLQKAWKDMRLELGQEIKPAVDETTNALTELLDLINRVRSANQARSQEAISRRALEEGRQDPFGPAFSRTSIGRTTPQAFGSVSSGVNGPEFTNAQIEIAKDHEEALAEIARSGSKMRLESERSYQESLASTQRSYQQSVSREAEDFARARIRQEADLQNSIFDIHRDAARREVKEAEALQRTIARARADTSERIADAQKDANERIAELDEDFKRNQARRQKDFDDDQLSAAGRLDAIALLELRKDRARQLEDAEKAHKEQRADLQEQLQERIDDENRALAKSIANAQEAHDRQLAEAREADALRIADMQADFEERKILEDEDRALRLARMAEDHQLRLAEMARQHALDLEQISTNQAERRQREQEEFEKALAAEGLRNDRQIAEDKRVTDAAVANLQRIYWAAQGLAGTGALYGSHPSSAEGDYTTRDMPVRANTPAYNPVGGWSRNSNRTVGDVTINIYGSQNQSVDALWDVFEDRFVQLINEN